MKKRSNMDATIQIQNNSYGFMKSSRGVVYFTNSGITVKGFGLKAQSKPIQASLQRNYIFVGFAFFIVIQGFINIPNDGEIMKTWIGRFAEDFSLFNMIVQFLLLVALPFAVAFWLADKAINPLRRQLSIPQKSIIPYEELTCCKLISGSEMELLAVSKDNSKNKIILTFYDFAIPLTLISKITSDFEELARLVGGEIDRKNNENRLKLKCFSHGMYIGNDDIDGVEHIPHHDASTLIINYLMYSWFARKK